MLPTQDRAAEAEAYARQAWAEGEGLAAAATLAWLLWRAGAAEAERLDRAGPARWSGAKPGTWAAGIASLLGDLAGDWASAQRAYLAQDRPAGAASWLPAARAMRAWPRGSAAEALALYDQAAELCQAEEDAAGPGAGPLPPGRSALADGKPIRRPRRPGRRAGADGRDAGHRSPEDRQGVEAALRALDAGREEPWPPWRWQRYDDALRISMLFRP